MTRVVALTGTPGVGKTTVSALLSGSPPLSPFRTVEVQDLPRPAQGRRSRGRRTPTTPVTVDLPALSREVDRLRRDGRPGTLVLVGHLSHLLPVQEVFLLRASPAAIQRRLAGRGGTERSRRENVEAERIDLILQEAVDLGRTIYELDTTGRPPRTVANWLMRALTGEVPPRHGQVDWLSTHPPEPGRPPRKRRGPPYKPPRPEGG